MHLLDRLHAASREAADAAQRLGITVEPLAGGLELISGSAEALRAYRRSIAFAAAAEALRLEGIIPIEGDTDGRKPQ